MKTLHIIKQQFILLLLLTILFAGCKKDFLEITPKGKLIAQTTSQYQDLLSNLGLLYTSLGNPLPQVAMGDDVAALEPFFTSASVRTQRLFHWDDVVYEPADDADEFKGPMANIYLYNKVINEVMNSTGGTEQEKKSVQAQAMAARAWTYFQLINYYGKPYFASSSLTDPGFPIVTAADATETKFTRASVKDVYDFIEKDLIDAMPNLPIQITHRLAMSKAAAEGILGKVYVFMGRFQEAIPILNAALTDLGSATVPVRLYDYNVELGPGGSFLPIGLFGPTFPNAPNNAESVFSRYFINSWNFTNNEIIANAKTIALFGASDLRLKFYSNTPFPAGAPLPAGTLRKKGPFLVPIGVLVPELYLLRAECKGRLNDLSGAKTDVETLRAKRMPTGVAVPANIASDQVALVKFILEERVREFAVQGFRWFDMRRLSVDPVYKSTVDYTHNVYSTNGTVSITFTLKPERFVLRFPQKVMDQNPGMPNNP